MLCEIVFWQQTYALSLQLAVAVTPVLPASTFPRPSLALAVLPELGLPRRRGTHTSAQPAVCHTAPGPA